MKHCSAVTGEKDLHFIIAKHTHTMTDKNVYISIHERNQPLQLS
jgi:hypothetical protein